MIKLLVVAGVGLAAMQSRPAWPAPSCVANTTVAHARADQRHILFCDKDCSAIDVATRQVTDASAPAISGPADVTSPDGKLVIHDFALHDVAANEDIHVKTWVADPANGPGTAHPITFLGDYILFEDFSCGIEPCQSDRLFDAHGNAVSKPLGGVLELVDIGNGAWLASILGGGVVRIATRDRVAVTPVKLPKYAFTAITDHNLTDEDLYYPEHVVVVAGRPYVTRVKRDHSIDVFRLTADGTKNDAVFTLPLCKR